ncbi:caspase family protein [Reichenbachiella versicolor]|uniref:caspase family protein n=1 Tax=Reichenbachiella versicolor TaxID=1821036 RepID=UPI000D6E28C1|nr:caspase family protein [Reichenbachiella versicolor]
MKLQSLLVLLILIVNQCFSQSFKTVIQRGHEAALTTVAYSNDGKLIATGSKDQSIILWEVVSGRQLRSFTGHTKTISDIIFHPSQEVLISAAYDKKVIFWDYITGKKKKEIFTDFWINSISISSDGTKLLLGGNNRMAQLIEIESQKLIQEFKVNKTQYGVQVAFKNEQEIIIGQDNGLLITYDISSGIPTDTIRNITPSSCGGCWAHFDIKRDSILYASKSGFQTLTGKQNTQLSNKKIESLKSVGLSKKHYFLNYEKQVKVFDFQNNNNATFQHGEEVINDASFNPDGSQLVTVSNDQTAKIWNVKTNELITKLQGYQSAQTNRGLPFEKNSYLHSHINRYLALKNKRLISPDEKWMIIGHQPDGAYLMSLETGRIAQLLGEHYIVSYVFTSDSRHIITGDIKGNVVLWEVNTGKKVMSFEGHREIVFDIAISKNKQLLATGSWEGSAILWNLETGELIKRYPFDQNSPFVLSFAHKDNYLLIGGLGKTFQLIELDSGLPAKKFVGHTDIVNSLQVKGSEFISSSSDGTVKIWNTNTGLIERKLKGHTGPINQVIYDNHDQYIITGGKDKNIVLWNAKTFEEIRKFQGHEGEITGIQLIQDDRILVSSSLDGTTRFWDLEKGIELFSHIVFDKNNWLSKTSSGYFDATQFAKKYVYFVEGLETYGLDQFFEKYYQPDILRKSLTEGTKTFQNNYLKNQLKESPPPKVEIVSPKPRESTDRESIEVIVKITNMGQGIDELRVMHNGKRISTIDNVSFDNVKPGKSIYESIKLNLVSGNNKVTISAFNTDRIESKNTQIEVIRKSKIEEITCHVVCIGINKYRNPTLNLNYAKNDAESFKKTIKEKGKNLFDHINYYSVYDNDASKANILKTLDLVASRAKPQDVLYFYYAGHGSAIDGEFFFVPTENVRLYDLKKLKTYALNAKTIQNKLAEIPALKQLVIIDACQSGTSADQFASRGAEEEKAMAQLSRSSGVHVLAASGSEQFASEFDELGHGLFTYVLLEALSGKADGAPKDGKVTIYELKSFIDDQVPEYSQKYKSKPQFPVTYSQGQDFPIVIE